jgi:hypothetical protein
MKDFYQYSVRLERVDGTTLPIAAYMPETARAVALHGLKTGEYVKATVMMRRSPDGSWFAISYMEKP